MRIFPMTGLNLSKISLASLVVTTLFISCSLAAELIDAAGLKIKIASDGTIVSLAKDGQELLESGRFSGFEVQDLNTGKTSQIKGKIVQLHDAVHFKGVDKAMQLEVDAWFRVNRGCISGRVWVEDLSHTQRAVNVRLVLNVKKAKWNWCNDLVANLVPVAKGKNYINKGSYSGHGQSAYPFGAIADNSGKGLAIGWPMDNPRFFSETFWALSDGAGRLVLQADLGISGLTKKFPYRADFEFMIYSFDGRNGFRGALSKYYKLKPECFETIATRHGLWSLWVNTKMGKWASRCGVAYNQWEHDLSGNFDGNLKVFDMDDKYEMATLQYSEPWGFWHPVPVDWVKKEGKPLPSTPNTSVPSGYFKKFNTQAFKEYLKKDIKDDSAADRFPGMTRDEVARTIFNTITWYDQQGDWIGMFYQPKRFNWGKDRRGWDVMVLTLNPDPDLPHPNRWDMHWKGQVDYVEQQARKHGRKIDALYLDSELFYMGYNQMNFRKEHWQYADIPLTYIFRDGKYQPAQAVALANVEFLIKNKEVCHKRNWPVVVNSWHPLYVTIASFADVLGAGEHSNPRSCVPAANFGYIRALAYRKVVSTMDYVLHFQNLKPSEENAKKILEPRANRYLMYGVYPGCANAWNPDAAKYYAPVLEKYSKLCKRINLAGWEPITNAKVTATGVLLERWGNEPAKGLYFTLNNTSKKSKICKLIYSLNDFSRAASAKELVDGVKLNVKAIGQQVSIEMEIPADRTLVIKVY